MNDFLQQLRSGSKRFDRNRKPYDGNQYRGRDRTANRDRKSPTHRRNYDQGQLHNLKKIIETIAEGQKTLTDYAQRQATATERIAEALEKISGQFKQGETYEAAAPPETEQVSSETATKVKATPASPSPEAGLPSSPSSPDTERKTVTTIIQEMRDEGTGFDEIALHLQTQKIPTLSGRGEWRAQVVSRLFNQQAKNP